MRAQKALFFATLAIFSRGKNLQIFLNFIPLCAAMFSNYINKFWLVAHRINLVKIKKNLFFGPIFGRKIGFSRF